MYVYMFMQNLTVCIVHPSLTEKELDNFFCSVSTKRRKWTIEEETMLKNVCAAHGKSHVGRCVSSSWTKIEIYFKTEAKTKYKQNVEDSYISI